MSASEQRPRTMREREGAAEEAMWRDIEKAKAEYEILMVPKCSIPLGAKVVECYETEREWVVVGEPWRGEDVTDPRYHNCDTMGCGTLFHVVARIQRPKGQPSGLVQQVVPADAREQEGGVMVSCERAVPASGSCAPATGCPPGQGQS